MKQRARQLRLLEATQRYLISRGMLLDPDASSSESELSYETISSYRSSFDTTEISESMCQPVTPVPVETLPVTRVKPAVMHLTATMTPVIPKPGPVVEKMTTVDGKAARVNSAPQMTGVKSSVAPLEQPPVLKRQRTQLNLTVKFEDEPVSNEVSNNSPCQNASSSPRSPKISRIKVSSKEKLFDQPRALEESSTSPRKKSSFGNKAKKLLKRLSSKNLFKKKDKENSHEGTVEHENNTNDQVTRVDSDDTLTPVKLSSSLPSSFMTRSSPVSPMSSPPNSARKSMTSEANNTFALNLEVFNSIDPNLAQSELNRKEARRTRMKRM